MAKRQDIQSGGSIDRGHVGIILHGRDDRNTGEDLYGRKKNNGLQGEHERLYPGSQGARPLSLNVPYGWGNRR